MTRSPPSDSPAPRPRRAVASGSLARVLGLPAARATAAVAVAVVVVALFAGAVRVLPLLLSPSVPARLGLPLLRAALGVALETGLFVAPPLAWALVASRAVERGEARALEALGMRPSRLVASSWPALGGVLVAAALAAAAWGREAAAPGRLAGELLVEARSACERGAATDGQPRAVDVPLVGLSWVCFPGHAPRIVGPAPFGGPRAALVASAVDLSDDLRALRAADLELVVAPEPSGDGPQNGVDLRVGAAVVRGLAPFGKASNLAPLARTVLLSSTAALSAWAAALVVLRARLGRRPAALGVGLAGAAAALLVFSWLERAPAHAALYLAVPLAGVLAPFAAGLVVGAASRKGGSSPS